MSQLTGVTGTIGETPLVELRQVVPEGCARVLVKVEGQNPTGSMKDRMALAVVEGAESAGRLPTNGRVVEYTGGSTGTSLSFVCAARGHHAVMVTSDAFSREKRDHMRALGAEVIEVPSERGQITEALIREMMAEAARLADAPDSILADQFHNRDALTGYAKLGAEIWRDSGQRVDVFVQAVGTAMCITGVGRTLRDRNPDLRVVAVEPQESAVLSGTSSGGHGIEGIGPGFVPPIWSDEVADEIVAVSTEEAMDMSRRLAREEALFAGTSSGANVVAALKTARELGPDRTVATLLCDSGLKYLSTRLYGTRQDDASGD